MCACVCVSQQRRVVYFASGETMEMEEEEEEDQTHEDTHREPSQRLKDSRPNTDSDVSSHSSLRTLNHLYGLTLLLLCSSNLEVVEEDWWSGDEDVPPR